MNIKDAYIHNGLGVLRELQVTAAGMLQLKRAAKDSNDAYVGWEDVYNLTNIKPTNAGTADSVPWTGITGKPETFPVATHDHDGRYLKLAGNTTSTPVTGPIYIDGSGLFIRSKDATKNIWEVVGDGTAWSSNYGFYLQYYGAGSGNNNDLVLYSHGQASTDVEVYRVHQDGSFIFKITPKVGTSDVYHAGNLSIGTLMGSAAIGDSDEPVYWSGSAFTKCGPFASSSHTHSVKINGTTKTIAAPSGTAVDLGVFMRRISTDPTESYSLKTALTEPAIITTTNGNSYYTDDNGASKNNRSAYIHIPGNSTGHWSQIHIDSGSLKFRSEDHLDWYTVIHSGNIANQSVSSATTATYASNVGAAGTAGTNYVTAAKVIATCNWYDTMTGSDTDIVINRWSEIVAFVANFEETPDLATYLSNNYLAKSGGTMTGQLKWNDSNALPEQTSPQYFLCIDAFNSGGTTKWASKANTLKALTGLTSTAIGDADEPVYWDGSKFVKAGAYPTKASWDYDDVYPKKYSYSLPPQKCVKITYSSQAPVIISAGRSNGNSEFLLAGLGYGADGWTRNQFRCLIPSSSFTWKLSATSCTVELYHNNANSGNAVVTVITTGSITFTETAALSGDADTKRFACYDELTWDNIVNKPATATGYGYVGTTAVQANSATQNLTGIKDSTFSGVMNITGRTSYAEGIRIHDYSGISSIWFRAVNADNYDAGMIGITADSTGLRFRLPASATGTSVADKVKIAYGGNVSITNALTVSGDFTASAAVYFTGLGSGSSDVTDDTELLTSYAGTSGFANTTGAGQVYRRQATKLYNYIKSKTDSLYVTSVGVTDDTTNHANQLRYVKGGSSTYFTVPFATNADTVDTYHAERLLHGAYNSSVVYDVLEIKQSNTPTEILIKTKLPFSNGNEMPSIYIKGFAYGNSVPIDIHLVFYIYGGVFCNCSATCYGVWKPQIFLFTYVENGTTYVGIGLKKSIYYPRFYVDIADIWGNNGSRYHAGWTYEINTSSETTIIPEDNKKELEYKALDTSILGSAGSVAWTNITGKPDTFPVEDIYLKLAGGTMTGAAPINFTHDKIAINFRPDSSSYYSKVQYMTAGNEALVFSNVNSVTSFIFKCGYNLVNGSNWNSVFNATTNIPSVQIKKQSLYVNAFINTNVNPDYNFYVGGTAAFTGQITSTVAAGTKPFVITSTTLNDNLNADLLDGFHAADFRNNIVDLRSSPQTFNPTYLKDIVFISEADYTTLVSNGSITKNSITHTYNASNWYVIEDKVPEYAENAGNADYASNAGHAGTAEWANNVDWDDIDNKPSWANSSLAWSDVTGKPTWVTWSETSSTATYSLSNATWTQTITLPTAAGSYILKLVSGNSTLTGVFSIGASDNAKDEISLHLHGNGPRLYARTNGTKLELSRNIATATNTSVTITYRRMI